MADILIVEDEDSIANLIRMALSVSGHNVDRAADGTTALEMVKESHYDLVILDLMLGGMSGEQVLAKLAEMDIPVMVVSAKSNLHDQIQCLRMGADDYITKPFDSIDLITRAEVVLRVHGKQKGQDGLIVFQHLTIDKSRHKVFCKNQLTELTPKEYDLLLYMIGNVGKVLSRRQIISEIWGYSFSKDNRTVDIHIQRLRKKLDLQTLLTTVVKVGYILELPANEN